MARPRTVVLAAVGLVGLGAAAATAAALLEDPWATAVVRGRLEEQGMRCDERFAVDASLDLGSATLAPTTCLVAAGPLASVELVDPVHMDLGPDLEPTAVRAGRLRVILRDEPSPLRAAGGIDLALGALDLPARLSGLVVGAVALARAGAPPVEVQSLAIARGDDVHATADNVSIDGRSPLGIRAQRVAIRPLEGPLGTRASFTLAPLTGSVTPTTLDLEGDLAIDAQFLVGGLQRTVRVAVRVEHLDAEPTYALRFL